MINEPGRLRPSVRPAHYGWPAFQRLIPLRSFLPESFRGGCSFGADTQGAGLSRRDHVYGSHIGSAADHMGLRRSVNCGERRWVANRMFSTGFGETGDKARALRPCPYLSEPVGILRL
jgi:hypothetical protein